MGKLGITNSFNMYKLIDKHYTQTSLLSALADKLCSLSTTNINDNRVLENSDRDRQIDYKKDEIHCNYLYFFKKNGYYK